MMAKLIRFTSQFAIPEPLRGSGEVLAIAVTGEEPLRGSGVGTFVRQGILA